MIQRSFSRNSATTCIYGFNCISSLWNGEEIFDWIDDALEAGEKLPGIGGGLHYLRQLYQLVRIPAVDRTPFHTMAQIHSDLHTTHQSLTTEFENSIHNLQTKWHGDAATAYVGAGLLAPEQLTPGADVAGMATAQKMQMSLAQIDEVLAYNGGANSAIADALAQIAQAQEALDGVMVGVAEGVGIEVGSIALDEIGVGEVIQGVEGIQLVNDVDEAIQTGEALKNVVELADVGEGVEGAVQTVKVVDEVEQIAQVAKFAQFATKTIQYVMAISFITSVVGVPLVEILGQLWVPPGGLGPQNSGSQKLTRPYPPNIQGDPQKERLYEQYFAKYGDVLLAAYLVNSGLDPSEVDELIHVYGLDSLQALAKLLGSNPWQLGDAQDFRALYDARKVPGINTVLTDILRSNSQAGLKGGLFELRWIGSNASNIAQLQLPGKDSKGRTVKGPDAQLKNGVLIQCKSYTWGNRYNSYNIQKVTEQLATTRRSYATEPITFIFDSTGSNVPGMTTQCLPDSVVKRLAKAGIYPAGTPNAIVTWDYWPPGNCPLPIYDPNQP